jgi:beta-glucosidase
MLPAPSGQPGLTDPGRSVRLSRIRGRWLLAGASLCVLLGVIGAALSGLSGSGGPGTYGGRACPWVHSGAPIGRRVAQLMSHMTLAQEIFLVEGHGTTTEGPDPSPNPYVFWMPGIPSLCIPKLAEEDGPAGVADALAGVTQLPAGVSLAAAWDTSLAKEYGRVIGSEALGKGADVNLGPTINIDRDPRWGRSFEAFTEDPFLNAELATSEIRGVQSTGEMSQVKHFAAYNQETYRNTAADNVIVSDRTLHEIYLPAFNAAVTRGKAASVMCGYAIVNGSYSCENPYLERTTLDDLWDFPGFVTSDFQALHSTTGAQDGTDQEQPFDDYFGKSLETAVDRGVIPRETLNTMVQRILTEMFRFNLFTIRRRSTPTATVTTPAHRAIGNQVADRGTVLLQNRRGTLPLPAHDAGTVAVIGPAASASPTDAGGGSAYVVPSSTVTPLQGLRAAAAPGTHVTYTQGIPTDTSLPAIPSSALSPAYPAGGTGTGGHYQGTLTAPETGTYVLALANPCRCYSPVTLSLNGREVINDPGTPPVSTYSAAVNLTAGQRYTVSIGGAGESSDLSWGTPSALAPSLNAAVAAARTASTAVVVVSDDTESETTDRPGLDLPSAQNELISDVAAANPHTVVVIDAGAPVAMPWLSQVASVLDAWYPGQSNGTSLADILFGKVNPSGHLPVTFPRSLLDVPASTAAQFPGLNGTVRYSEGLDVGYRWYDAHNLAPLFPFGFGLSYTKFAFSRLTVQRTGTGGIGDVQVSATIRNVGKAAGADVAQLYLDDPARADEPPRQLVGFHEVSLAAGSSTRVHFTITPRDTWWWDQVADGWAQSPGRYQVYVGDSSALANLPLRGSYAISQTPGARQVVIHTPGRLRLARGSEVTVGLARSPSGHQTLPAVRLSLQVPQGWTVRALGASVFHDVRPSQVPVARFVVTPPRWYPLTDSVVHATADLSSAAQLEAGSTVSLSR